MRFRLLLSPLCAVLLGSCAYQGTIVQKDATPSPFDLSYGVDNSYAFLLRDSTGVTRRQIVTAEVYNEYAVGEYFSDLQPRRASDGKSFDGKTVMTAMMSKVTTRRSLATRKPELKAKIATTTKAKKSDVKVAKQSRPAVKAQQPAPAVQQPTRIVQQPTRIVQQPARVMQQPVRVMQQPARVVQQPVRVVQQPVRVVQQPVRVVQQRARVMQQPARVAVAAVPPLIALPVEQTPFELQPRVLRQPAVWEHDLAYVSIPRCR